MGFINTLATKVQATGVATRAKGQAMVEYGMILVLVSVVALAALFVVGGQLYNPAMNNTVGGTGDIVAATTTVPVHIKGTVSGETYNTGHVPGAFNSVIFALSNGARDI
jgi:Flp pilus assembly pilin Flp